MSNEDDFTEAFRRGLEAAAKMRAAREVDDIAIDPATGDLIPYDTEQKPMRPYAVMATFKGTRLVWDTVTDKRPRDHDKPRPLTEDDMRGVLAKFKTGKGCPIPIRFGMRPMCNCGELFCPYVGKGPMLTLTMDIVDPISGAKTDATNSVLVPETARRDVASFRSWVMMRVKWLWLHECNEFLFYEDRLATDPHPEQPWYAVSRAKKEAPPKKTGSVTFTLRKASGDALDSYAYMMGELRREPQYRQEVMGRYVPPDEDLRPVDRNGKRTPGYVDRLPKPTHRDKFSRRRG